MPIIFKNDHISKTVRDRAKRNEIWSADSAEDRDKITNAINIKRYRNIGFSDEELQSVFRNIKENSSFIEGGLTGRKIRRLNVDNWDDQDLVNKMSLYMNRHLRRVIQENNYGEMMAMGADGSLGKTLFQFK